MLDLDAKDTKKLDVYLGGITQILYDKKTSQNILGILKSAPPEQSVKAAALQVNDLMEAKTGNKNLGITSQALLYTVQELVTMGNEGGFFQLSGKDMMGLFQDTMQQYVHKGLKEGSIDPVELQKQAETLMSPEQKERGLAMGQELGVPPEAGREAAMEQYADQRVRSALKGVKQ